MNITEKAAYLKGLAEGIALDPAKPETKLINALIDCVNELALTIADMDEDLDTLEAYIEEIDEDLGDAEEYLYGPDDGCDCGCDCDCDCDFDESNCCDFDCEHLYDDDEECCCECDCDAE